MWSLHMMEYDSAIKRNEVLTYATIWISFEYNMLSTRSQTQKATNYRIPWMQQVQKKQVCTNRKQIRHCQGLGVGGNRE